MSPNGRILATLRRRQSRLEDKVGLIKPVSVNTDQGNATTLAVADDRVHAHLGDNKIIKPTDCVVTRKVDRLSHSGKIQDPVIAEPGFKDKDINAALPYQWSSPTEVVHRFV